MKYLIWICTPNGYTFSQCFFDQAYPLRDAFVELGHECEITTDTPVFSELNVVVLGAHLIQGVLPESWIIYNLEQVTPGSPWMTDNYIRLLRGCKVWDYCKDNVGSLGIKANILPVGYMPCMSRLKKQEATIDVLHYGSMNQRREYIIALLKGEGVTVHHAFDVFGKERDELIQKSRLVLNVSYYESKIFNITRCGYLFANGVPVVSEVGRGSEPFHDTGGFCEYDELVNRCVEILKNPEPVGAKGYEIFSKMNQTEYLCSVL